MPIERSKQRGKRGVTRTPQVPELTFSESMSRVDCWEKLFHFIFVYASKLVDPFQEAANTHNFSSTTARNLGKARVSDDIAS